MNNDIKHLMHKPRAVVLCVLFIINCALVTAQDRSRVSIYVPMPTGGVLEQRTYFQNNFKMELVGANYPIAETKDTSTFTFQLDIQDNPDFISAQPADDQNKRYVLGIKLERSIDNAEIVNFDFPFNDLESMSDWNLYLLYQAMANAYLPEFERAAKDPLDVNIVNAPADSGVPAAAPHDSRWQNKLLYAGGALGLDMGYFVEPGSNRLRQGMILPAMRLSVEYHFLEFLAAELTPLRLGMLGNGEGWVFEPAFGLALMGVFRVSDFAMLQPYAGVELNFPLEDEQELRLSFQGGAQIAFLAGNAGAVTVDFNVSQNMVGRARLGDGVFSDLLRFTLLVGYKHGFLDRGIF